MFPTFNLEDELGPLNSFKIAEHVANEEENPLLFRSIYPMVSGPKVEVLMLEGKRDWTPRETAGALYLAGFRDCYRFLKQQGEMIDQNRQ